MSKYILASILLLSGAALGFAGSNVIDPPPNGTQAQCNAYENGCEGWEGEIGSPHTVACCCIAFGGGRVCHLVIQDWYDNDLPDWRCYALVSIANTEESCTYTPPTFIENYEYIGSEDCGCGL